MVFLDRAAKGWGLLTLLVTLVGSALIAFVTAIDLVSIMIGLALGLTVASFFVTLRIFAPAQRSLIQLSQAQLAKGHPLASLCAQLLSDAKAGRALLENLRHSANINAISAAEVSYAADQLKLRLDRQVNDTARLAEFAGEMTSATQASTLQANDAAALAQQASSASQDGRQALVQVIERIRNVHRQSDENLLRIQRLNEKSNRIQGVTSTIQGIAEQTNLLALNAAIEAARAGHQGRGFAVVADEVRQLARRTAEATADVAATLGEIREDTAQIVTGIEALTVSIEKGVASVESVGAQLDGIREQSDQLQQQVSQIANIDRDNEHNLQQIFTVIETVRDDITESDVSVASLAQQATRLMEIAETTNAVFALNSETSYHRPFFQHASIGAAQVADVFAQAMRDNKLSVAALFDRNRQPVANTNPPKYTCGFDRFTDQALPVIQEAIKGASAQIIYAITTAPDGYVPTHNREFAHAPTGNAATDLARSRSKRLFNDRTGIRCGSHTQEMLLQTYRRDTGEIMHDLSVPIYIDGKHWGGFRIGYHPQSDSTG
ncbi:MAG: methyl-accepting chemotaxis protein [Marinobacter sp.]